MHFKRVQILAVTPLVLASLVACSSSSDDGGKTIKVASSLSLAPLEFVDTNGEETGYEVDVLDAVMDDLGYKIEWVNTPFEQLFTGLQAERFRMGASGVYARCERINNTKEFGTFALPIGQAGQIVTTRSEDGLQIAGWEDLEGLTLGVESAGSTADKVADANASAGFEKQIFPDTNALMLALEQGRIDAAMQSSDVTRYTIKDNDKLEIAWEVPDTAQPYSFIFREGDELIEKVNDAINDNREDGTFSDIYEKYFGEAPASDNPASPDAEVVQITSDNCRE